MKVVLHSSEQQSTFVYRNCGLRFFVLRVPLQLNMMTLYKLRPTPFASRDSTPEPASMHTVYVTEPAE